MSPEAKVLDLLRVRERGEKTVCRLLRKNSQLFIEPLETRQLLSAGAFFRGLRLLTRREAVRWKTAILPF